MQAPLRELGRPLRPLEDELDAPMSDRLLRAAERAASTAPPCVPVDARFAPRAEQRRVLDDVAEFLLDAATAPLRDPAARCGRIVLPPRTGKTVIAGHVIARAGLASLIVVPTRTLVEQTAREMAAQLPGVAIATWFGEVRELAPGGVHVTTYAMLQRAFELGTIPGPIARSALVFFDEGHHTLTPRRIRLVRDAFDPHAVRIALTATPDYDEHRTLCRTFPALIHEITLEEALALELLAPLRFWVAEVDAEGSTVRVVAGDYDDETLGRVMSGVPFVEAALRIRYAGTNAMRPTLVACATRQQAHDLWSHWRAHRTQGAPEPALILGETPREERERTLDAFERGAIDTVVQVAVLLEGWTSVRCKLLVDLSPSLSRVRATQKYFRVMTRAGSTEARIYVLLPRSLPALPILPHELFGSSMTEYECGALVGRESNEGGSSPIDQRDVSALRGLRVRSRLLYRGVLEAPLLDRHDDAQVRAVLRSNPEIASGTCPGLFQLRGMWFEHRLFRGRGDALLRWLRVAPTRSAYVRWLARLWPEHAAAVVLAGDPLVQAAPEELLSNEERAHLEWVASSFWSAPSDDVPPQERAAEHAELTERVLWLLGTVPPRLRRVVAAHHGLCGHAPTTLERLGRIDRVSHGRMGQIEARALRLFRRFSALHGDDLVLRKPQRGTPFERGLPGPIFASERGSSDPFRLLDPPVAIEALPRFAVRLHMELHPGSPSSDPRVEIERGRSGDAELLLARVDIGVVSLTIERRRAAIASPAGTEREVCSEYVCVDVDVDHRVLEMQGRGGWLDAVIIVVPRGRRVLTDAAVRALVEIRDELEP